MQLTIICTNGSGPVQYVRVHVTDKYQNNVYEGLSGRDGKCALPDLGLSLIHIYFGYTPEHLSRLIKKTTGYSFLEILKKERMQKAEHLLTKSTIPISEISAKLGYMNPESFVRAFKSITGVSPGVFRQSKQ